MATVRTALNGKSLQTGVSPEQSTGENTGLVFNRYFTDDRTSPFDAVEWERQRDAQPAPAIVHATLAGMHAASIRCSFSVANAKGMTALTATVMYPCRA